MDENDVQLCQPQYSIFLTICEFKLFPKQKISYKGFQFDNKETVEINRSAQKAILYSSSRTALESGNTDGSALFDQMGISLKDASGLMTENNTSGKK